MKDLVIYGAGGFGREVLWLIQTINKKNPQWNVLGFIDNDLNKDTKCEYNVIGDNDWLLNREQALDVVCCVGSSIVRKKIIEKISGNKNLNFPSIIAETVRMSDSVNVGHGSIICDGSIITVDIEIKDFSIINLDCTIGHDAVLEEFVTLYPSVNVSGNVIIGHCTEIGTGSNIIQGVKIGYNSIVGAGSVVVKEIPSNCTAVGAPAKPIKFHE